MFLVGLSLLKLRIPCKLLQLAGIPVVNSNKVSCIIMQFPFRLRFVGEMVRIFPLLQVVKERENIIVQFGSLNVLGD